MKLEKYEREKKTKFETFNDKLENTTGGTWTSWGEYTIKSYLVR